MSLLGPIRSVDSRGGRASAVPRSVLLCTLLLLTLLSGCASIQADSAATGPADTTTSIYIIRRAQHTGIAIPMKGWPNPQWALLKDFSGAEYLEFGWGDERFYQAEEETLWLGVRAALWPTSSVIHVIGLNQPIRVTAQADDVVQIRLSAEELREVALAIEQEFTGASPRATGVTLAAAPVPNRFYSAKRSFYFPRMCNWWVAKHLQLVQCPVTAWTVITAGRAMKEARECATLSAP
jgi:uncharacterized protein (TIGR02117 family)